MIQAEDLPYWKTGTSAPDKWLEKAATEIERAKGSMEFHGLAKHPKTGKWFYLMRFKIEGDFYKMEWPVLSAWSTAKSAPQACRRQAATMLYHDVKAACVKTRVLGARVAFFAHLEVDGGRTASELGSSELVSAFPLALPAAPDDVIDGELAD